MGIRPQSTGTRTGNQVGRRQLLRMGAGVAGVGLGITALGGKTAAHFPEDLEIDVKPGSDRNPINPRSRGVIPVAVLGTDEFDPTSEAVRYRFGAPDVVSEGDGARPIHDGLTVPVDGREARILFFPTRETGFDAGDDAARLVWEESPAGEHGLAGTDAVTVVGRRRRWWR